MLCICSERSSSYIELPFQEVGMTGPPAVSFPSNNDAFEGPIVVTDGGFPYLGNRTATRIYVSVLQFPNTNPENTIK